ncbi:hypothetical protein C5167_027141 [Papaver somniferum]|uniref:protein EXORDIUM-like 1 n=1 Tax=Papaver somniferum TaxID=3469 RepID=UPI000E6FE00D|nr:protein EXORDIUM-like 1 [Papaver somniferum]RZC89602.1 hypothetical protein C5167_027141 [Papaver somniferum]
MASSSSSISTSFTPCFLLFACLFHFSSATSRSLNEYVKEKPAMPLQYHNGRLLSGQTSVNLIWYGNFKPSQTANVYRFFNEFFTFNRTQTISTRLKQNLFIPAYSLGRQIFDTNYSLGNFLTDDKIARLATSIGTVLSNNAINVVLTSADVAVDGFCSSRCGSRGSSSSTSTKSQFAYIWVGISEDQCPEKCASPFLQQICGIVTPAGMTRLLSLASALVLNLRP